MAGRRAILCPPFVYSGNRIPHGKGKHVAKRVLVKMTTPGRGSFNEEHVDHPGGAIWIRGDREFVAGQTRGLLQAVAAGYVTIVRRLEDDEADELIAARKGEKFAVGSEASLPGTIAEPAAPTGPDPHPFAKMTRANLEAVARERGFDTKPYRLVDDLREAMIAADTAGIDQDATGGDEGDEGDGGESDPDSGDDADSGDTGEE